MSPACCGCRAHYLAGKGKGRQVGGMPWERVIAGDFRALLKAGLAHPAMPRIEAALGIAPAGRPATAARRTRK
jgi:hypothetical protein